jgi:8-oxo-dGTP diphosphatase
MKTRLEFAQKAFIVSDGSLLLVRKSEDDPHHPGLWEVPGGRLRVSADLDLEHHIRREVWEEVGIKIDPGSPFHLWDWHLPLGDGGQVRIVAVARCCRPASLEVTTDNQTWDDHLADAAWVGFDAVLDYPLIPALVPVMKHFLTIYS